jgi:hypothetical protein
MTQNGTYIKIRILKLTKNTYPNKEHINSDMYLMKKHELRKNIPLYYKSKEYGRKYERKTDKIGYPWSALKTKARGEKMAGWW